MNIIDRIKDQYATVYVTIVSILLGLALEDLISIFREIEMASIFDWFSFIFVAHIVLNAWISYANTAISIRLAPVPMDAINVFLLTLAHFSLNTFIGQDPYRFFFAVSVYSLIAGLAVYYNLKRANQDDTFSINLNKFRTIIYFNLSAAIGFGFFGLLSYSGSISEMIELIFMGFTIPFASAWLWIYWSAWKKAMLEYNSESSKNNS